jgi:hypothetical protein
MKKPLYIFTILANCLFALAQKPYNFTIQPAIEVDANFYKITLELKEGKNDDDYKQKDKVDLPVTFLFNDKFVTGKYTGSCIKIKVFYTDSKKEQSDKLYLPNGKGKFTSALFSYDGDWQFDNLHGMGTVQYENNQYQGSFIDSKFNGVGTLTFASGDIYHGYFNQNKIEGVGKMNYAAGDIYDGNFIDFKKHGNGTYTFKSGESYNGQWVNDNFNGNGQLIYANGDKYIGEFADGKFQGKGSFIFKSGQSYIGQWANNKYNGKGKLVFKNGDIYEGDFVDGKIQGSGTYTYSSGELYVGQWANNKSNGKGKLVFKNGDIYEGDFVDGKRQGNGTLTCKKLKNTTDPNGNIVKDILILYTGQWANDLYNGKGKLTVIDTNEYDMKGSEYEGDFVDGKKHGNGIINYKNVENYTGQFANDLYNGHGEWSNSGQFTNSYTGDFVDGKRQGNGTSEVGREAGYETYTGKWANDLYNGQGKLESTEYLDQWGEKSKTNISEGLFVDGVYQPKRK